MGEIAPTGSGFFLARPVPEEGMSLDPEPGVGTKITFGTSSVDCPEPPEQPATRAESANRATQRNIGILTMSR